MSKHAQLSPSSSERWLNCPGSISACEGVVDTSSVFADEGTFAHKIAETVLRKFAERKGKEPVSAILKRCEGIVSDCKRFTADAVMLGHLDDYVHHCAARIQAGPFWIESKVQAVPGKVYGTADFIAVDVDTLEVIDFKYGAGVPVSPVENSQAKIYAIGALDKLMQGSPHIYKAIKTVRICIFQPRCSAGGGTDEISKEDLLAWHKETLLPGVKATEEVDGDPLAEPPRCAGDWCRFCPVKGSCYALKDAALTAARGVFADVTEIVVAKKQPDPRDLTVDQIGKALEAVPLVETWIKALHEHAYNLANGGTRIPGHKIIRKVGNRVWTDEAAAKKMLVEMLPEGESPYAEPKLLSPAQAEKKLDPIGKALVDQLTHKPDAGTALVPDSDKRPAFLPGDVFTNQEEKEKK